MAAQSRRCRVVIVPCLCASLIFWQLLVRQIAYSSQVGDVQVARAASKFAAPPSPVVIAKLEAMSQFANLALPASGLPEGSWLLGASDAPELALHRPALAVGDLAEEAGGVWGFDAARLLTAGIVDVEFPAEFDGVDKDLKSVESQIAADSYATSNFTETQDDHD
jgi:hypothetical protein